MAPQRTIKKLWSKSFPTTAPAQSGLYKCAYEGYEPWRIEDRKKLEPCTKAFSRQCDLRRHQLNHTRPFKCKLCSKGFPSPKDLQRHDSTVHNPTITYLCSDAECSFSAMSVYQANYRHSSAGFKRKDHWRKHMKDEHNASRQKIQEAQKEGIPMAVWREEMRRWVVIKLGDLKPGSSETESQADTPLPVDTSAPGQPRTQSWQVIDPVIQVLAEKAAADPDLKGLMTKVVNGEETPEEFKELQRQIDELQTLNTVSPRPSSQAKRNS